MNLETVIGLEIHAELNTKSKIFCNCSTKFGAEPNTNVCPICMGLPGTLPVMNQEVISKAMKAGLALNCTINEFNKMDRKNYFYPDLPKAYQISQYDKPICTNGIVRFQYNDKEVKVRINRIHMEEDAGKLIHLDTEDTTLIDYNRVGVPLIEIVTEPDLRSPGEAVAFLKALKGILEYSEVSDCKMEEGSLRCDANISLRELGSREYGTKVEIKNINSFKEVQRALEKEEKRQKELLKFKEGNKIVQETRRWDASKAKTIKMRSKEDAHDYRYFPEPDLRPFIIRREEITRTKEALPEMPIEKSIRFAQEFCLNPNEIEILVSDKYLAEYFEEVLSYGVAPKDAANWILADLLRLMKEEGKSFKEMSISAGKLAELISIIDKGTISKTVAKDVLAEMFKGDKRASEIIAAKGLSQISSTEELNRLIEEVLLANPNSVKDFKNGKKQAISFLMGQVMKQSRGKANPSLTMSLLNKKLTTM